MNEPQDVGLNEQWFIGPVKLIRYADAWEKGMIAIFCNSNIYFIVFFAKRLKPLAYMPRKKLRKF